MKMLLMYDIHIGRNIRRTKNSYDPISLDNIALMGQWVAEEPGFLDEDNLNWDNLNPQIIHVNVEDDDEFIVLNEYIEDDDRCVEDIVEGLPVKLLTLLMIPS